MPPPASCAEEAGIEVPADDLGEPIASGTIEFTWGGAVIIVQAQTFYAIAVGPVTVSFDGLDPWERATTDRYGWFTRNELRADSHQRHPLIRN